MGLFTLAWLAMASVGAHLDWQLLALEQVRAGNSYTPGITQPNTLSMAEIASPGGKLHLTFSPGNQDLVVNYQPRFLNTYRLPLGGGSQAGYWAGWTQLHRVLSTYRIGDEQTIAALLTFRLVAGQLDLTQPDGLIADSGYLPGALGQTLSYINGNLQLDLVHRFSRHWRFTTKEQIGITQYPAQASQTYFAAMPNLGQNGNVSGNEKQLRLISNNSLEYLLDGRTSLFASLQYSDVSYQETASYPALSPTVGLASRLAGGGSLRMNAGLLKYWTNPLPGIIDKPQYLIVADVTYDHSYASMGLPRLSSHMVAKIAPYYNLQFSDIEPRATVQARFDYKANRGLSFNVGARLLSSLYWNFGHFKPLQRGHPKNIWLLQAGLRYSYQEVFILTTSLFGSLQDYQPSSTLPYTQLDQVYVLLGLQGAWPRPKRIASGQD